MGADPGPDEVRPDEPRGQRRVAGDRRALPTPLLHGGHRPRSGGEGVRGHRLPEAALGPFRDLVSITSLKTDEAGDGTFETTWAASDYELGPIDRDTSRPYTRIDAVDSKVFPTYYGTGRRARVEITGVWGWAAIPVEVKQACLIKATRLLTRMQSPNGIAGLDQFGPVRISRSDDPDVVMLLEPLRHPSAGVLVGEHPRPDHRRPRRAAQDDHRAARQRPDRGAPARHLPRGDHRPPGDPELRVGARRARRPVRHHRPTARRGHRGRAAVSLFPFLDWSGSSSIPAAINADRKLGGLNVDARVRTAEPPGLVELPDGTVAYGVQFSSASSPADHGPARHTRRPARPAPRYAPPPTVQRHHPPGPGGSSGDERPRHVPSPRRSARTTSRPPGLKPGRCSPSSLHRGRPSDRANVTGVTVAAVRGPIRLPVSRPTGASLAWHQQIQITGPP